MSRKRVNQAARFDPKHYDDQTARQVDAILETAAALFETWGYTGFAERLAVIATAATLLHARVDGIAEQPPSKDLAKLIEQACNDVLSLR